MESLITVDKHEIVRGQVVELRAGKYFQTWAMSALSMICGHG